VQLPSQREFAPLPIVAVKRGHRLLSWCRKCSDGALNAAPHTPAPESNPQL
jgi:hypothetical protein